MASVPQTLTNWPRPVVWFGEFLKEELAPYPGRLAKVTRMVISATIVMILIMIFRIPFGPYALIYTFNIARESAQETVRSTLTEAFVFLCTTLYILFGAMLFLSHPMLRLLWVVVTLFLMFFVISIIPSYKAVVRFGWLIIITIPLWDSRLTGESKLEGLLWAVGALTLASLVTVTVELIFAELQPGDELTRFLAERLSAVEDVLKCYATGCPAGEKTAKQIARLAMLGTSSLRRILQRSNYSPQQAEQMGAVVALVGRLVDIAANATHLCPEISKDDRERIHGLMRNVAGMREDLLNGRVLQLRERHPGISSTLPLFREMATTVSLIAEVFAGSHPVGVYDPSPSAAGDPRPTFFARDALSNPSYIQFALKGCLATSLCYIFYNAKDWPEINTAVTTCFLTALSTIGSSRQKQVLRICGALAGAAVGLAAQVFILPQFDSIGGYTLGFAAATALAAWIATSGPRLSYAGLQFALACYLINVDEFKIQTSLYPARDRTIGIMLGLFVMWLVFDQLWGVPAVVEMRKKVVATMRLLAQFTREPLSKDLRVAAARSYSLRQAINESFEQGRLLGDAVLFEFGASRDQDLAWRNRVRYWQPQVRIIFLTRIALWKYRAQLPGFELPPSIGAAQKAFDEESAKLFDAMADRIEGKAVKQKVDLRESYARLEQAIRAYQSEKSVQTLDPKVQSFLQLSGRFESLTISVNEQV